jgi:hypothetical protein
MRRSRNTTLTRNWSGRAMIEIKHYKKVFGKLETVVEAIQYNGSHGSEIDNWSDGMVIQSPVLEPTPNNPTGSYLQIIPKSGKSSTAGVGDWIIKEGNKFPHKYYRVTDKTFQRIFKLVQRVEAMDFAGMELRVASRIGKGLEGAANELYHTSDIGIRRCNSSEEKRDLIGRMKGIMLKHLAGEV